MVVDQARGHWSRIHLLERTVVQGWGTRRREERRWLHVWIEVIETHGHLSFVYLEKRANVCNWGTRRRESHCRLRVRIHVVGAHGHCSLVHWMEAFGAWVWSVRRTWHMVLKSLRLETWSGTIQTTGVVSWASGDSRSSGNGRASVENGRVNGWGRCIPVAMLVD